MKIKNSTLVFFGIVLACLAWRFQNSRPTVASFLALTGAVFFLICAKRLGKEKKRIKAERKKNMYTKNKR